MTNETKSAEGGGAVNAIEAAAVAIFAELNPGVHMDDADFPHYEAAAKAAFAQAPNADAIDALRRENVTLRNTAKINLAGFKQMKAERDAADKAGCWQPIKTAPKDGTRLLLWAATDIAEDGRVRNWKMATGSYNAGYETHPSLSPWRWDGHQLEAWDEKPTHWMPLPTPPNSNGGMETTKSAGQEPDEPQEGTPALPHHRTPTHPRHKGTSPSASRDRVAADLTGVPQEERGWQVVPVEPTSDMANACREAWIAWQTNDAGLPVQNLGRRMYRAMLTAAPKPQAVAEDGVVEALRAALERLMNQPTMSPCFMTPDQRRELWAAHEQACAALTKDTAQGDK